MASKNNNSSTTQVFLDIHDISNNFVILKDGTVSILLTINAMNFGLLAEAEQDAVIYAYAALLNSLNYPIQILIQSKTKDATAYLNRLKDQEDKVVSPNKKERIARYRQFVSELIKERNVLDKKFYVAVPATATELGLLSVSSVIPGNTKFDINSVEKLVLLEKAASVLEPKRDHLIAQFNRIGLYARQLNTQEIIQVFYNNYNPESYEGQEITDTNNYTTPLVQAQIIGGNMNLSSPANNQVAAAPSTESGTPQSPPAPVTPPSPVAPPAPATPPAQTPPAPAMTANMDTTMPSTPATPAAPATDVQEPVASLQIPGADGQTTTPAPAAAPQPGMDVKTNTPENKPAEMPKPDQSSSTPATSEPVTPPAPMPAAPTPPAEPKLPTPDSMVKPSTDTTDTTGSQDAINQNLKELDSQGGVPTPPSNQPAPDNKPAQGDNLTPLPEI